ncbi:hypothetical protein ACSLBF_20620 (plasmid) [Pseudoalteromonas sp. T1lg65]|uniref:hypothetical protein n=1 Tax=Pseudoalteromonas sp. T1lg65 TaxID=2077101 RepID=UPI003F79FB9A
MKFKLNKKSIKVLTQQGNQLPFAQTPLIAGGRLPHTVGKHYDCPTLDMRCPSRRAC